MSLTNRAPRSSPHTVTLSPLPADAEKEQMVAEMDDETKVGEKLWFSVLLLLLLVALVFQPQHRQINPSSHLSS